MWQGPRVGMRPPSARKDGGLSIVCPQSPGVEGGEKVLDEGVNGQLGSNASVRFAIKGRVLRSEDRCTVSQVKNIMGEALGA